MDVSWEVSREQVAWGAAGLALAAVVAFVLYTFVGALVFALFVYYATRPVHRRLDDHFEHPDAAAAATLLVVALPMLAVLGYAFLVGVREFGQFLQSANLEQYRSLLQPYVDLTRLTDPRRLTDALAGGPSQLAGALGPVAKYAGMVFFGLVRLFVMVTVAFYLLRDDYKVADWFRRSFDRGDAVEFMEAVDADLDTVYTGNLITVGVTAAIAAATFYALDAVAPQGTGIAHPLLLGFVTGIFTLVPAVGMKLVYVPYAAYLFADAVLWGGTPLWFPAAFLLVTLVVVDTVPDFFIRSYVSKGDLHMGLVLLSYVLGSVAFGWYGLFLGPIVLVLSVHFARAVLPRLVSDAPVRIDDESVHD